MRKLKVFLSALLITVASAAFAQNITVKGVVSDASNGEPLPGAAILVKGSPTGTVADFDGSYSITVSPDATLGFTTIGFKDVEIAVNGRTEINVELEPDSEMLAETIVVAFGTSTKEAFTGSAKVVSSDDIANYQVSNVASALSGQVAGVQLVTSNGAPGSSPSIRIRGTGSISAGKEPLYVVDGIPYDGDISDINPADVESMTVLKDAASNALYGARGSNGVIMITTKKPVKGRSIVTFDAKVGANTRALQSYEYITNPAQYYETHYEALKNYYMWEGGLDAVSANLKANEAITGPGSGGGLGYQVYNVPAGQLFIGSNGKVNPYATLGNKITTTDGKEYFVTPDKWEDHAYRTGLRQEYNLSVASGNEKASVFGSVAYLSDQGITEKSDLKRITARLKADYQVKDWLKFYANASYANVNANSLSDNGESNSTGNVWAFTSNIAPIYPLFVRDGKGEIMTDKDGNIMMDYGDGMNAGLNRPIFTNANAIQSTRLNTRNTEGNVFNVNGGVDVKFLKHFKATIIASENVAELRSTTVSNPYYGQFKDSGGTVGKEHYRSTAFNTQQILDYSQSFGKNNVDVMVGHEFYDYKTYLLYGAKQKMFSQDNKELDGAVIDNQNAVSNTTQYSTEGFIARAQYDYDNKIFASASFRRDASTKFAPEYKWGNFWSAGAAWIISKENWFNASWIDFLKLKASYGQQGNDDIGYYLYTDLYSIVNSSDNIAVVFGQKGKREISWEKIGNFNTGVEFTFFDGVLDGSVEYFYRKTTNMLFAFNVAPSNGYDFYYDNIGDLYNQGVELSLTANIIKSSNVNWSVFANATSYNNKITYLHEDVKTNKVEGYEGYTNGSYFFGEGLPLYTRYMRSYAGIDGYTGKTLWWKDMKDSNGNVIGREKTDNYGNATQYLHRGATPDVYGGFGTSLKLYGVDINLNFSYSLGGYAYDSGYASLMGAPYSGMTGNNMHVDLLDSWTPDHRVTNIPRLCYNDTYSNGTSDRFLADASYLNIDNINVGYTFPNKLTKKFGVESLRLYAAAENVFYFSARKGFDPRYSFTGSTNSATYSPIRTISGGVTLKF